ncbi:hypothetical protein LTR91_005779 [Friedmanniomyces endolithicus]|uniref:PH domain-containing protein n=2 Tax=Friedmanniomyces endolithicus TaxID=329885 RepID=A0AAN6FIM7_9PEZI|nr:hypothetical protein LTS09_007247 [Friedmanniomyces endolithicus]KAK0317899.1 hypothetical protein LTR82_011160 [Friedmanniomyces endolithicus]KAK0921361.1 hypothetical protein LTR57_008817 [Friedmanniomyces endolithicus]KAK1000335.1 hypothetical protein LTR91_005779 [Friedmanniomyces endolithicus]KAK1000375.1 hypothetical protein LTS01_004937 [Friedmanniomyces endolithicus]
MSTFSQQTTLPTRGAPNSSTDDMDEAIPDEDASEATKLFNERLSAWRHACGYLVDYISATEKMQQSQGKEYEKVLKTVSHPLKEGHHFDQSLGGIAGMFDNIRSNTAGISNSHYDTAKTLKGSVLPIFERLHTELKNKAKELTKGAGKGVKTVDKSRQASQKHIELLGQHTAAYDSTGGHLKAAEDPYILQRQVYHRLSRQVLEENNTRDDVLAVQNSFAHFEAHVVQTFQNGMAQFNQVVTNQAEQTRSMYGDMIGTTQRMPPDFEWNGFVKRNSNVLIDPSAPKRAVENIAFPNQDHRSTQPLIAGSLERRGKMLKRYDTGFYVVTPAKYLHEFKTDDDFAKDPSPENSLYLPDSLIGAVDGVNFTVKGKDASKGSIGSKLSMAHEFQFKAHTPQDAQRWHDVIASASGQTTMEMSAGSGPSSPVASRYETGAGAAGGMPAGNTMGSPTGNTMGYPTGNTMASPAGNTIGSPAGYSAAEREGAGNEHGMWANEKRTVKMADSKDLPETAPSTPSSRREEPGSRTGKDRQCPFCGLPFTSSSLGRHLDLYIKPRNPKPPDGVHHVDEIKKLRGSITRRQPKTSLKPGANVNISGWRQESEESTAQTRSGSQTVPKTAMRITEDSPVPSPVHVKESENMHTSFNVANWQATGVINDLPPRAPTRHNGASPTRQTQRLDAMRRDATGARIQRPDYDSEHISKLEEDAEVGRAAELALREVLGSLEAAKRKVEPSEIFPDVNFFSLAYPGLCLAILPAPPTLFSATPFAGADTWSLAPPGPKQYDALSRHLHQAYRSAGGAEQFPDSVIFRYSAHASGAYEHWQALGEEERAAAWNLEVCRAFARAQEGQERLRRENEAAGTRIRHLEAEYERLSRCQLPREYLLHPPNTLPTSSAIVKELSSAHPMTTAAEADYDVDDLLNRWRTTARATKRRQPLPYAPPRNAVSATTYTERPSDRSLQSDMLLNGSVFGVNGAMPRTTDPTRGRDLGVEYEVTSHPGAIVSVEDEGDEDGDEDEEVDVDADGEVEDGETGLAHEATSRRALVRQKRTAGARLSPRVPMKPWALLNINGKRAHASAPVNGREEGPKMYKERWPGRGKERAKGLEG